MTVEAYYSQGLDLEPDQELKPSTKTSHFKLNVNQTVCFLCSPESLQRPTVLKSVCFHFFPSAHPFCCMFGVKTNRQHSQYDIGARCQWERQETVPNKNNCGSEKAPNLTTYWRWTTTRCWFCILQICRLKQVITC